MPFTISHAAAVLPFSHLLARWRLLSATIIGSMVPDFGWFLPWPWRPARFETHSALSLLTFSLPVGLITFWIFQWLIKTPWMELLPDGAYARWRDYSAPADYADPLQWVLAACGVIGGAITHLVWDAFTHEGARGVRMIPALDDVVLAIHGHQLAGAHLLQDASSLLGLAVVTVIIAYGLRPARGPEPKRCGRRLRALERGLWIGAYVLMAGFLSGAFLVARLHAKPPAAHVVPLNGAAIATLRGLGVALLLVSVILHLRLQGAERTSAKARSA
jgi:Domain of unknown function (DUF4184)